MSVIDIDDPRVKHLIAMPSYLVGRSAIDDGPTVALRFAQHRVNEERNTVILRNMADFLKSLDFDATVDTGEWPGAGDTLSVAIPGKPEDQLWYCEDVNGVYSEEEQKTEDPDYPFTWQYIAIVLHNQNTTGPDNETIVFESKDIYAGHKEALAAIVTFLKNARGDA